MFARVKGCVLTAVMCMVMAAPALAADNGMYLGLKFIDSIQSTGVLNKSKAVDLLFDSGNEYSQNTLGGGVAVGYDFYPAHQVPIRAELEYALRNDSKTSWDMESMFNTFPLIKLASKGNWSATMKSKWNLQTLFMNAYYDFHNDTAFTPYVGAGIGLGFIYSAYSFDARGNTNTYHKSWTDYQTVLAWNVGVGCNYAITDNLSVDLAYRFVGLDYFESSKTISSSIIGTQKIGLGMAPHANEFSLGFRYTF